ncbi:hypothetical protein MACH24_01770 [Erythrobacter sp. Dej080120_24]|uniref:hypothetical protein n=1 Tax=Erythrobacter sp. Dej080120_24 TaxID=3024837 RepID=UPI002926702F|nr:hypothetical protein MACH24_01770 [Erythrobacter sp. Dej080120_24]
MHGQKGSRQVKIPAHIKEGEKEALTRHWQKHFLDHLAESSNITESAKVAGNGWRRNGRDICTSNSKCCGVCPKAI